MSKPKIKKILAVMRATVCAWFGHSRVTHSCFGYQYCARCNALVGDTLAGVGLTDIVGMIEQDSEQKICCPTCNTTAKQLTWRDTLGLPSLYRKGIRHPQLFDREKSDRELQAALAVMKEKQILRRTP